MNCIGLQIGIIFAACSLSQEAFFGNNVTSRKTYLELGMNIMVDSQPLGLGILDEFFVYVHDLSEEHILAPLSLQIWTSFGETERRNPLLLLKWERNFTFEDGDDRLYSFKIEDEYVLIDYNDRLGVASEGTLAVSLDYVESHSSYYLPMRKIPGWPEKGRIYTFVGTYFPAQFSMGVNICTDEFSSVDSMYFGNDLEQEGKTMTDRTSRAWVDDSVVLAKGKVELFYIHSSEATENFHLQIWRHVPSNSSARMLALKWEKQVTLSNARSKKYEFLLTEEEEVEVDELDRIGWTYLSQEGHIHYRFEASHATYFHEVSGNNFPVLGTQYNFDLSLPYAFSVGVQILKSGMKKREKYACGLKGRTLPPTPPDVTTVPSITKKGNRARPSTSAATGIQKGRRGCTWSIAVLCLTSFITASSMRSGGDMVVKS